jgi:hypothetical protein
MQVTCPNCGEKVAADHINIHKMTAVCASCDTVFPFDLPEAKSKRRKVKQPAKLTLRDAETLHMEFWTNFRLDRDGDFLARVLGSLSMGFVAVLLIAEAAPLLITLGFTLVALALFYAAALVVLNKTHIEMDEDAITVRRKPLPNPLNRGYEVSLAGLEAIRYEETAVSKKEAYDTPRYRVWAETADGGRRTIVTDVTEDYAVFIAQCLSERLYTDADLDVSRLEDDETDMHEVERASRNKAHHR